LAHQVLNLLGTFLGCFCQRAHFISHHGKALAVLASASGFNRGIQGQQVGLIRNAGHRFDNVTNVGCLLFKFTDHLHRGRLSPR